MHYIEIYCIVIFRSQYNFESVHEILCRLVFYFEECAPEVLLLLLLAKRNLVLSPF